MMFVQVILSQDIIIYNGQTGTERPVSDIETLGIEILNLRFNCKYNEYLQAS